MLTITKFYRLQARQKESGLSVKGFCENEGIPPSSFYYWQKKLRKEANEKRFIPLVVKNSGTAVHSIIQKEPMQKEDDALLEITYPNGITLRTRKDLDLVQLRALISLMD